MHIIKNTVSRFIVIYIILLILIFIQKLLFLSFFALIRCKASTRWIISEPTLITCIFFRQSELVAIYEAGETKIGGSLNPKDADFG